MGFYFLPENLSRQISILSDKVYVRDSCVSNKDSHVIISLLCRLTFSPCPNRAAVARGRTDQGPIFAILYMEVRRWMIVIIHLDHNAVESADLRH